MHPRFSTIHWLVSALLAGILLAGASGLDAEVEPLDRAALSGWTGGEPGERRAVGSAQAIDTTEVTIDAITGLQYDPARFQVPTGGPVRMVVRNADDILHNLVVTTPDSRMPVVRAAAQLGSAEAFVPDTAAVLHATAMLRPGGEQVIRFDAPEEDGVYPYVCTYPGHGVVMYGAMYVGAAEMPPLAEDPHLPERVRQAAQAPSEEREAGPVEFPRPAVASGHPFPLRLPAVYRTFLPRTTPAAIAVGMPGGESYAFDAGVGYLRYAWHGGFVDNSAQWAGNGDAFTEPLGETYFRQEDGFPFRFGERDAIPEVDFRGYAYDEAGYPIFRYRAAGVTIREHVRPRAEGDGITRQFELEDLEGTEGPVYFDLGSPAEDAELSIEASAGDRENGYLRLIPEDARAFSVDLVRGGTGGSESVALEDGGFGAGELPAASGSVRSERIRGYPYRIETIPTPEGLVPETGGVDFLPDGRMVAVFRRGEVLTYDAEANAWSVFAAGLHDPLGVVAVSNEEVIVGQRPEITRLTDTDGDGRAERFETLTDDFGMSGNYSEFTHGPIRDAAGNLYFSLNTASNNGPVRAITRGTYSPAGRVGRMFSAVPYRGWVMRLSPDGTLTPWASGFRSPNGLALDGEGRLFVPDNQGDWLGTSKLFHVQKGNFHGHPSSLAWEEEVDVNPLTIPLPQLQKMRERAVVQFPQQILSNSPTQPVFDETGGRFGPFEGQMFVGEMNHPVIMRVVTEEVNGQMQGAVFPFVNTGKLRIGNNRMTFGPEGSLWVGQTDHGWPGDRGIQRVVWTGETPFDVDSMSITREGFELTFTRPLDPATVRDAGAVSFTRFYYAYGQSYGSGRHGLREIDVEAVELSDDRRRVTVELAELASGYIYQLRLRGVEAEDGTPLVHQRVFYTVNALPPPGPAEEPGSTENADSRALNR